MIFGKRKREEEELRRELKRRIQILENDRLRREKERPAREAALQKLRWKAEAEEEDYFNNQLYRSGDNIIYSIPPSNKFITYIDGKMVEGPRKKKNTKSKVKRKTCSCKKN